MPQEFSSFVYFFVLVCFFAFLNKPGTINQSSLLIKCLFSVGFVLFYLELFINLMWKICERIILVCHNYGGGIVNKGIMNVVSLCSVPLCYTVKPWLSGFFIICICLWSSVCIQCLYPRTSRVISHFSPNLIFFQPTIISLHPMSTYILSRIRTLGVKSR